MKPDSVFEVIKECVKVLSALLEKLKSKRRIPGTLYIRNERGIARYYRKESSEPHNGVYLPHTEIQQIRDLAQQEYEQKVVCFLELALRILRKVVGILGPHEVYERLPPERKALVMEIDSDDDYAAKWLQDNQCRKAKRRAVQKDGAVFRTEDGDLVGSKSEHMIANRLKSRGITYIYEAEVWIRKDSHTSILRKPDFLVLNKRTRQEYYLEHFGMMDDPAYVSRTIEKLKDYESADIIVGKNLIVSFENREHPLDTTAIDLIIDTFLV